MSTESPSIARALTVAAESIHRPTSLEETLDTIVQSAVLALPAFNHAGISITHRDGRIETMSGTDQMVWEFDQKQYELREGPCVESIRSDPVVVVEHARHDQRWPRYMPWAVQRGLRAQLGLRLYLESETLGGLNLYSTASETIDDESREMAELFATHAAIALGRARKEDQLNEAIATRKVIGQAIGIVSERYQLTEDRAFQFLTRASQTSNIKLRTIAQEIVESTNEKYDRTQH
ncbi:GAF and ANTAR domain-containing protein [Nocardioides campestrisoli]|uniref:GAF and ANTAR domain-containing protein n=1 Tax=Nocardioides campestrisoli TaxID=2736757 RepID=UPI0015E70F7C|nr:GAF and ANTAR domain-containing protein [Nocardioides campestrisoli]